MPESFACEHCRHEVPVARPFSVCRQCGTAYRHAAGEPGPLIHSSPVRFRQVLALVLLGGGIVALLADRTSTGLFFCAVGWCVLLWCGVSSGVISLHLGRAFPPWKIYRVESSGLFTIAVFVEALFAVGFVVAFLLSLAFPS